MEMSKRPFAAVLEMAHFPGVGVIMDIIIFTALVSAFSANIYASSRIAYSLASRGMGPRWLLGSKVEEATHTDEGAIEVAALHGDIEHGRTPRNAVAVSVVFVPDLGRPQLALARRDFADSAQCGWNGLAHRVDHDRHCADPPAPVFGSAGSFVAARSGMALGSEAVAAWPLRAHCPDAL